MNPSSFSPWFAHPAPSADLSQPYMMASFFPYADGQSIAQHGQPHHHHHHQEHSELLELQPVSFAPLPGIQSMLPSSVPLSNSDCVYYSTEQLSQPYQMGSFLAPSNDGLYDVYHEQGDGQPEEAQPHTRPFFSGSEEDEAAPSSPSPTPSRETSCVASTSSSPSPFASPIPLPPPPRVKEEEAQKKRKRKHSIDEEEDKEEEIAAPSRAPTQHSLNRTFDRVVGRLGCIGTQKLYLVMVDEIERRISYPEGLTQSLLGPLLKRGKVKGCNDGLQELMERRGLDYIKTNRRKFPLSTLSGILEEEGEELAADHQKIVTAHFPFVGVARLMVRGICSPVQLQMASEEAQAALEIVRPLVAILRHNVEEAVDGGRRQYSSTSSFFTFAKCTHGLGMNEALLMATVLEQFLGTLDHEMSEHVKRVNAAAVTNPTPLLYNKFPENTEPCELPEGRLPTTADGEECTHSRFFVQIPGRLGLSNGVGRKYNITVGEMYRRVRQPECLNLSILGSTLRKAKTKDNGLLLRNDLARAGINLDLGRRKTARVSLFTPLAEGEALALAKDVQAEVDRSFPFSALASQLNTRARASLPHDLDRRIGLHCASRIAKSLADVISALQLPVADRLLSKEHPSAYLIHKYSSLTHGYGPDAAENWMMTFHKLFDLALENFD